MPTSKNIFQIHKSYDALNAFEKVSLERWNLMNPSYSYHFYTDENIDPFIESEWPDRVGLFRAAEIVHRASIQRLACVYRDGGIYADCDLYPLKPVDEFLDNNEGLQFFRYSGSPGKTHDYLFYADEKHPFIRRLIEDTWSFLERSPEPADGRCWKGWIFEGTIHLWSKILLEEGVEMSGGCTDSIHELIEDPARYQTLHFSSENWIPENRWESSEHQNSDCLNALNALKKECGL